MWFGGIIVAIFVGVGIFFFTRMSNAMKDGFAELNRNIVASENRTATSIAEVKTSITRLDDKVESLKETVFGLRLDVGKLQDYVYGPYGRTSDWQRLNPSDDSSEEGHPGQVIQAGSRKVKPMSE
jgi:hypothetical protein